MNGKDNQPMGLPSHAELDQLGDIDLDELCDEVSAVREANPGDPVAQRNWDRLRTYIERRARNLDEAKDEEDDTGLPV